MIDSDVFRVSGTELDHEVLLRHAHHFRKSLTWFKITVTCVYIDGEPFVYEALKELGTRNRKEAMQTEADALTKIDC